MERVISEEERRALLGESEVCGRTCEVFSRVTGYYRPTMNWNPGKKEEFRLRKYYNVEEALHD